MRFLWISGLLSLFIVPAFSQPGSVKGFVYDKANGEPVAFSNVYFQGTTIGSNTDLNGYFNISRIPPGDYILVVTNLDFDTIKESVSVKAGSIINKKIYAVKGGVKLEEVEVTTTA